MPVGALLSATWVQVAPVDYASTSAVGFFARQVVLPWGPVLGVNLNYQSHQTGPSFVLGTTVLALAQNEAAENVESDCVPLAYA